MAFAMPTAIPVVILNLNKDTIIIILIKTLKSVGKLQVCRSVPGK